MNKTSNYAIFLNEDHENKNSYLGKLRSNFLGTQYVIYNNGLNKQFAKE